jgi:hypothetical protein
MYTTCHQNCPIEIGGGILNVVLPAVGQGQTFPVKIFDLAAVILMRAGVQDDSLQAEGVIDDLRNVIKLNVGIFQKVRDG